MTIGSDSSCDISIANPGVSPRHAFLLRDDHSWVIVDARSQRGTFVNGRRVQNAYIAPRDRVEVGGVTLIVGVTESEPAKAEAGANPWWYPARWWNRATKAVLGAGALASAVAAVLSLFAPHPTVNNARFTSVQLIGSEPLDEYQQRLSAFTFSASDDPSPGPEDDVSPSPAPSVLASPPPVATVEPSRDTFIPITTGPASPEISPSRISVGTVSPSHPADGIGTSQPGVHPDFVRHVQDDANQKCLPAPYCEQFIIAASADGPGKLVRPEVAAKRVNAILQQTETTTNTTGHKPEPLGEVVSVNIELTGLRGHAIYLGWSIYPANGRTSLYGRWLNRFIAYRLEATTDDDTGSMDLWIPLPKTAGSYFARITLFTAEADLASEDSRPFS
jgi:hypothetical protein